jgi:hypothetical protein
MLVAIRMKEKVKSLLPHMSLSRRENGRILPFHHSRLTRLSSIYPWAGGGISSLGFYPI